MGLMRKILWKLLALSALNCVLVEKVGGGGGHKELRQARWGGGGGGKFTADQYSSFFDITIRHIGYWVTCKSRFFIIKFESTAYG